MGIAPGSRLGPYEIVARLGAGGMGEVYRARDTKLQRDVAIKVVPASLANDPAARARFDAESRAVAMLSHPNIIAIFDAVDLCDMWMIEGGRHFRFPLELASRW